MARSIRSEVWAVVLANLVVSCTGEIGASKPDPDELWSNHGGNPSGGGGEASSGAGETQAFAPPPASLRRLLARQYRNSVRDLLGEAAAAAADPPADSSLNGFDAIGAAQLAVGDAAVAKYDASARAIAQTALSNGFDPDAIAGCSPISSDDADCYGDFVARFGRRAWRRSLEATEIDAYAGLATQAAGVYGDVRAGYEYAIAGLLQSPFFIYQVEIGEALEEGGPRALTGVEIATRMSFFLLDTTPSEGLLDDAESGALDTADGVRDAARALMADPSARQALSGFYDEFFKLRDLPGLTKSDELYPQFTPSLAESMRQETLALIEDVVWERDVDFLEILDAPYTFADEQLASLYGVPAPEGGFGRIDLPADQGRGGILGQAGFLSVLSHREVTSPTLRGRFVRENLMCQSIPPPPANVVTELPSDEDAKTMRQKLEQHRTDPTCAGCHTLMDDIGLGLENFDAIGAYRTTENGETIDAQSSIDGMGDFKGPCELGRLLRKEPEVASCIVKNLFRGATGHVETKGEAGQIEALEGAFDESGHRLQDLLVDIVSSDAFRIVGAAE